MILMKNKMKIIKNKKAQEGAGSMTFAQIVGFLIAFALLIFALLWYGGMRDTIIAILKNIF